jgi:hypothetical protein
MKQSDADARARAATEVDGIGFEIERQAVQAAQTGRHRQRELRTRTEPGVGRNDLQHIHRVAISERKAPHHLIHVTHNAFVFRPGDLTSLRPAKRDFRAQTSDRKAGAAETAAETTIEVEEA